MYYLMNKDIALFGIDIVNNSIRINNIIRQLPGYIKDIDTWIIDRINPVPRESIRKILKMYGINTLEDFEMEMKAVSVTDCFWIKSDKDKCNWSDVSPHQNRLSMIAANIILDMGYKVGDIKSPSPDFKVGGTADKFWKRINGKLYLYKTSGTISNGKYPYMTIRPYCEYYASQIAERLGIDKKLYIQYRINANEVKGEGLKPYVYCPSFTSEKYGYMPISHTYYSNYRIDNLLKEPQFNNQINREIALNMIMLDAIIVNIDRHTENYGFLIDNDTLSIKGLAPIFDNDCSLGALQRVEDDDIHEAYLSLVTNSNNRPKMGFRDYISQGKAVLDYYNFRNRLKSMYPFKFDRLPKAIDLPDERIQFMEYIVNNQIKQILKW